MGFSSQEYWSALLCLPPGDLPDPGIKPASLMSILNRQAGSLPLAPPGKVKVKVKLLSCVRLFATPWTLAF